MKCRLCEKESKLCESHIVSEFLYRPLYNDKHQYMAISGRGKKGWKPLQKGVRENLLCSNCECYINDNYEKPFLAQWSLFQSQLPDKIKIDELYSTTFNYTEFKLFHLSILFRVSISSLKAFQATNIGPKYEQRIRQMLLQKCPGRTNKYPIIAYLIPNENGEQERRFISAPFMSRYGSHRFFEQVYGGAVWRISVSSHHNEDFVKIGIQPSGIMMFCVEEFKNLEQAKLVGMLLRRAKNRQCSR